MIRVESNTPKRPQAFSISATFDGETWNVDVSVGDHYVGGGTTPDNPLDVAADILYGDKNDWLNGDFGALARA